MAVTLRNKNHLAMLNQVYVELFAQVHDNGMLINRLVIEDGEITGVEQEGEDELQN